MMPLQATSTCEMDQVDAATGVADPTDVICYLFAPEYIPVEVHVSVRLPTAVANFLSAVRDARSSLLSGAMSDSRPLRLC